MKGIFLRGKVWWLRYSAGGHQQFESLGTENEAAAIQNALAILENPERKNLRLFDDELEQYLKSRVSDDKMRKNTRNNRGFVLQAFATRYGITNPALILPSTVEKWDEHLRATVSADTRNTYLRWLRTFLDHLVKNRKLRRNPVEVTITQSTYSARNPFCSAEQVRQLIDQCRDPQLKFILYCGFHAGLRREEIVQARPHWFDLENGLLHVQRSDDWKPKNRSDRTIPLTSEFAEFLKTYGRPDPFMIAPDKKQGKWRYRYDFVRPFSEYIGWFVGGSGMKCANAHGSKDARITVHTMRHTFASLRVSAGRSVYKVASWLGDSLLVTERHYAYLTPKDKDVEI